jgi:hypothetical protein
MTLVKLCQIRSSAYLYKTIAVCWSAAELVTSFDLGLNEEPASGM